MTRTQPTTPIRLGPGACRITYGDTVYVFERFNGRTRASVMGPDTRAPDVPVALSRVPVPVMRAATLWFEGHS